MVCLRELTGPVIASTGVKGVSQRSRSNSDLCATWTHFPHDDSTGGMCDVWFPLTGLAVNQAAGLQLACQMICPFNCHNSRLFALDSRLTCTPRCCTSLYEVRFEANRGERSIQSM
jgi:hypothetical protein